MTNINKGLLIEKSRISVSPLTENGEFQLDTVEYGNFYATIQLKLVSKDMAILFNQSMRQSARINGHIFMNSVNKNFNLKYLIPALDLKIILKEDGFIKGLDYTQFQNDVDRDVHEIVYLYNKTGFFTTLNHLCLDLKSELPAIKRKFSAEDVENSINCYVSEFRKMNKDGRIF